jgi:hypothetical protein
MDYVAEHYAKVNKNQLQANNSLMGDKEGLRDMPFQALP